ncbi:MAG: Fe-S cluster assembly protein SufD [Fluviicola sp.]|nr:MAG: Fe-S cluster assembly protein SufD [Fluviicola sp.]
MEITAENKVLKFVEGLIPPSDGTSIRKEALQALNGMDFPTTRVEEWKYTRVGRITNKTFQQEERKANIEKYKITNLDAHLVVFVNGYFDASLSTIKEDKALSVQSIEKLDLDYYSEIMEETEENVFSLINKGYQTGGVYIKVGENEKTAYPIHLLHLTTGEGIISNAQHFIHLEKGSKTELITTYDSDEAENSFTNIVIEGHIEENANLTIQKLQFEEKNVFHISNEFFVQDPSSQFKINTITTGSLLTRNGLNVIVEGENCHTEMNGVYLGTENQHLDNHTLIEHLYSNCTSSETYKGVMDDKSTGVFNGKVIVRPNAKKIEAYQSNGNILLSKSSTVNSKPELEIYADDVRCSHGSTTGQLDEDAIYYLRTRGISEQKAKKLMVAAFIGEVLDKVDNSDIRKKVDQHFLEHFGWVF